METKSLKAEYVAMATRALTPTKRGKGELAASFFYPTQRRTAYTKVHMVTFFTLCDMGVVSESALFGHVSSVSGLFASWMTLKEQRDEFTAAIYRLFLDGVVGRYIGLSQWGTVVAAKEMWGQRYRDNLAFLRGLQAEVCVASEPESTAVAAVAAPTASAAQVRCAVEASLSSLSTGTASAATSSSMSSIA